MVYVKNHSYRDVPFSPETPKEDFSTYDSVTNLYAKCESSKYKILKIRTVGILKSENGCFFIYDIPITTDIFATHKTQQIFVSMAYMHKSIRNPYMPQPVQIIGKLQWKGVPVIYAQIIQPLKVVMAILLRESLDRIVCTHLCIPPNDCVENAEETKQNL